MSDKTDYELGYNQGLKDGQQLTLKLIDEVFDNATKEEPKPGCKCERTRSYSLLGDPKDS